MRNELGPSGLRSGPLIALALVACSLAAADRHHSRAQVAQPGAFDYYLLSLSWSPEYCFSHRSSTQCASDKHFGFVVHGLWPESNTGANPENCSNAPGLSDPSKMLDIMPDTGLIQHEWTTHGTCTGLSAENYFGLVRQVFSSVHIPPQLSKPASTTLMSAQQIKQSFEQANSGLPDGAIGMVCRNGYLNELEICFSKDSDPKPMACPNPPSACPVRTIKIPPVR